MNLFCHRFASCFLALTAALWALPVFAEIAPQAPTAETQLGSVPPEAAPAVTPPPAELTLPQILEKEWEAKVEVFPEERDMRTPDGYRIMSAPGESAKVLKRMTKESSVGVKAILTLADGTKYYVSGWSWERAHDGVIPTWIRPLGQVTMAAAETSVPAEAEKTESSSVVSVQPEEAADPAIQATDSELPGRIVALLFGNGRYSTANPAHAHLDLPTVAGDLRLLTESLTKLRAQVRTVLDGDRAQILDVIEQTINTLEPSDTLLIYYTGHGVQIGGKNYLAPAGISFLDKDQVRATSVPVDQIVGLLNARPHRFSAVLLDGSRNNPFNNVDSTTHLSRFIASIRSAAALTPTGLADPKGGPRTVVACSASPGTIVSSEGTEQGTSPYARALATSLSEDVEFRDALDNAGKLVRDWTKGAQSPCRSTEATPLFFAQLPGRKISAPDTDAQTAGHLVSQDIEQGFPLALARLARSLRNQSSGNPSTAALLYLLSYQAVPIPLQSWGPFKIKESEFAPGLKASIDGTYIGLIRAKEESPFLIINRFTGEQTSGVEDTFAPSQDATVASRQTDQLRSGDGQPLMTWSIHRAAWDGGQSDAVPADPRVTSPILKRGKIVASFYDEGLERVFLATLETPKVGAGLYFWEYALTPPINSLPAMFRERRSTLDFKGEGDGPLQLAAAKDASWSLNLARNGHITLADRSGAPLYQRTDGLFDDWLVSDSGASILLLYRDQVELLGLDGKVQWTMATPWPVDHRGSLLAFSSAFQRIFVSHLPENAKHAESRILAIDTKRGEVIAPERTVEGYPQFAAMSGDGEWFFFYDKGRRLRMWDSVTAGRQLDLPSTRVPMPLPIPGTVCEADPLALPTFHAVNPPLIGHMPESYNAPLWLPDLAEALAGFRINNEGTLEWLPNATQKLRDTAKAMNKQTRDSVAGEWAVWFLENRLRAVPR
jgi:uncharacterized caspase-like protein